MRNVKKVVFSFFLFFFGILVVSAAYEGVSDTTHYTETDKKTNYIKLELMDGNVVLFEIDTSSSSLARVFKNNVFDEYYDGLSFQLQSNKYVISNGSFESASCSNRNYITPVFGDILALVDGDSCSLSGVEIYLGERGDSKAPVIGHAIAGSGLLKGNLSGIKSIRFVEIEKDKEENSNSGSDNGSIERNSGDSSSSASTTSYCSDDLELLKSFKFVGRILSIIKIMVPIVIIVLGMIDFFKAVVASKDDEIKKSLKSLMFRLISGLVIFFVPTLVNLVFRLVDDWNQYRTDYSVCSTCVTNPSRCKV